MASNCKCPKMVLKRSQNDSKMIPKWSQSHPKMVPKWSQRDPKMIPKSCHNGPKMIPNWSQSYPKMVRARARAGFLRFSIASPSTIQIWSSLAWLLISNAYNWNGACMGPHSLQLHLRSKMIRIFINQKKRCFKLHCHFHALNCNGGGADES